MKQPFTSMISHNCLVFMQHLIHCLLGKTAGTLVLITIKTTYVVDFFDATS